MFAALRSSPATFKATSPSATCFSRVAISDVYIEMSPSSLTFKVVKSFFSFVATLMLSSVSSITFKQYSFFSYSACCSAFRSADILSIMALTFVKGSSFMRTTSEARSQLCDFLAVRINRFAALAIILLRAALSTAAFLLICKKLKVLPKSARASSPVRIVIVSVRAVISSSRALTRLAYSSSAVLQFSARVSKNCSSAVRAFVVDSMSSLA
mmetsp:Transcript_103973/g.190429  ORF Transcript_103973/g.190429 Transcript_103973/m.190429 type:complete len:212 (-) Transcript_103973:1012-1647(-)